MTGFTVVSARTAGLIPGGFFPGRRLRIDGAKDQAQKQKNRACCEVHLFDIVG